jgi:acyl-CoA thioester hydrolase
MDAYNHVNNARYVTYLESARIHLFMKVVGADWQMVEEGPVLGFVSCKFRHPVEYPARVEIGTKVTKIGNASFELLHRMYLNDTDTLVCEGHSTVVWTSRKSGRSTPLGDELRQRLAEFVEP